MLSHITALRLTLSRRPPQSLQPALQQTAARHQVASFLDTRFVLTFMHAQCSAMQHCSGQHAGAHWPAHFCISMECALSHLLRRCAAAAQPNRPEGSEQSPASGAAAPKSTSSPATTAASSTASDSKAGAADSVRRRRAGVKEISPADPPDTSDGPPQGPDGVAAPELINVFSWKVLTLSLPLRGVRARVASHVL